MSTTNAIDRGRVKTAVARVTKANNGAGNGVTIKLPPNSILLRTTGISDVAFDGTGTVTLTSTDGTTAFWSAVNVKDAAGFETVSNAPPKRYKNGGTITTYITDQNGDSVLGDASILYEYAQMAEGVDTFGA